MSEEGWKVVKPALDKPRPTPNPMKEAPTGFAAISGLTSGRPEGRSDSRPKFHKNTSSRDIQTPAPNTVTKPAGRVMPANPASFTLSSSTAQSAVINPFEAYYGHSNETPDCIPAETIIESQSYTIEAMRATARLVYRFRSKDIIPPEALKKYNPDPGTSRNRGERVGAAQQRDFGRSDFARGRAAEERTPEAGARGIAESWNRGTKTIVTAVTPKSRSKRFQEDECDPDLVIERVDVQALLEETAKNDEEEDTEVTTFVRRQAKTKAGEDSDARVARLLRGFLNKLTDTNYKSIFEKTVGENGISTKEHLENFVNLVFEKASQMEKFVHVYSRLLIEIRDKVVQKGVISDTKEFKLIVLTAAQDNFSTLVYDDWAPSAELDDEEQFNATVLRKNQRRGLANFVAVLTVNGILATKVLGTITGALVDKGSMAQESDAQDAPFTKMAPVQEKHMEVLMNLYTSFMDMMRDSTSDNPTPKASGKSLLRKVHEKMNPFIVRIEALITREDHTLRPSTRISFLLEDLCKSWHSFD